VSRCPRSRRHEWATSFDPFAPRLCRVLAYDADDNVLSNYLNRSLEPYSSPQVLAGNAIHLPGTAVVKVFDADADPATATPLLTVRVGVAPPVA